MTDAIQVQAVSKLFRIKESKKGFKNFFSNILRPEFREIKAVHNLSLSVSQGECLAFIGPNGAGKSTTIKMLTGILFPSSGKINVLGYDPATQRKQLSKHVGTVFGQRPQLWYHLPAIETLHLLARIYGVPSHEWKRRLEELTQRLELEPLLRIPVRKLSLGQRMRCEIAASLLHGPRILFLDEPTIGLDVVAKQQIRTFIKQLNKTEGTTVFLTSHDPSDIEALAQRAVVINGGKLVFDGSTHEFVRGFIKKKTIEVVFAKEIQKPNIPVGNLVLWENCRAKVELENANHQIGALLGYLAANFEIQDINIYDPEMEEIIRSIYAQTTQTL